MPFNKKIPAWGVWRDGVHHAFASIEALCVWLHAHGGMRHVLDPEAPPPGLVPWWRPVWRDLRVCWGDRSMPWAWVNAQYACHLERLQHAREADTWFRRGPIPDTRKRRGRYPWRHPRTTAERRQVAGRVLEDDEPAFRGRRRHLPSSYDDIQPSRARSWKAHRRHQWKAR